MKESLTITAKFNVPSARVYSAWLDSEQHGDMTGGEAIASSEVGAPYSAWDGYISGKNVSLKENEEIVQTWRTTEFAESDEDSRLVISFKDVEDGCEMTITHTNVPEGQTQYEQGWLDHYVAPMTDYFG